MQSDLKVGVRRKLTQSWRVTDGEFWSINAIAHRPADTSSGAVSAQTQDELGAGMQHGQPRDGTAKITAAVREEGKCACAPGDGADLEVGGELVQVALGGREELAQPVVQLRLLQERHLTCADRDWLKQVL